MKKILLLLVASVVAAGSVQGMDRSSVTHAVAQPHAIDVAATAVGQQHTGKVASEVTTKETGVDGKRHSNTYDWTTFTVPDNTAINKDLTKVHTISANGSEKRCDVEYADYVEVVPGTGIKLPRTIRVRTFARSPKGHSSGRGWMKVNVDFTYVEFK